MARRYNLNNIASWVKNKWFHPVLPQNNGKGSHIIAHFFLEAIETDINPNCL